MDNDNVTTSIARINGRAENDPFWGWDRPPQPGLRNRYLEKPRLELGTRRRRLLRDLRLAFARYGEDTPGRTDRALLRRAGRVARLLDEYRAETIETFEIELL